jgi:hypothetical protein
VLCSAGVNIESQAVSPNGIIYAKPNLRKSLLAKMLSEILETRVMVKNGMKLARGDKVGKRDIVGSARIDNNETFSRWQALLQVLNARQLGLKLMAVSCRFRLSGCSAFLNLNVNRTLPTGTLVRASLAECHASRSQTALCRLAEKRWRRLSPLSIASQSGTPA